MNASLPAAIPIDWADDPTRQLQTLRAEVLRQLNFPAAEVGAFMLKALDALQRLAPARAAPEHVLVLIEIGRFFFVNGNPEQSVRASGMAVAAAVISGDRILESRARMAHGTSLRDVNDLYSSLNELSDALEIAQTEGDAVLEAKILNNLGNWYHHVGLCTDARYIFERIADDFLNLGDRISAWMALDNAALAALKLGDIQRGLALADRASEVWTEQAHTTQEMLWVVQGMSTYCLLLIEADRTEEAALCARTAQIVALASKSARAMLLARMVVAVANYLNGKCGAEEIEFVLEEARRDSSHELGGMFEKAIRAYERADELDKALALQEELLILSKAREFESTRRALGRTSPDETHATAKLAQLGAGIDRKVNDLLSTAVTQALRSGHDHARIFRVGRLAELFAISEAWQPRQVSTLKLAAQLIDIGTMVVPDNLLRRPLDLSDGERGIFEEHAKFGAEVLSRSRLSLLEACVPIVRFHHERWDGSGPAGLAGQDIPIEARVVALCDAFDELTHSQPWRLAESVPSALRRISEDAGGAFDQELSGRFAEWLGQEFLKVDDFESHLAVEALDNGFVRTQERIRHLIGTSV